MREKERRGCASFLGIFLFAQTFVCVLRMYWLIRRFGYAWEHLHALQLLAEGIGKATLQMKWGIEVYDHAKMRCSVYLHTICRCVTLRMDE